jgi:Flp pilus assembly protein TadD
MKIRSLLFALAVSGCGGGDVTSTPKPATPSILPTLADFVPTKVVVEPVTEKPLPVEIVEAHILPTKYEEALALGRELATKGQNADAKEMLGVAVKLAPKAAEPHVELARVHIAMNERGLAVKEANKAVKLAPLSSQAWNTKGRAELLRYSYDDAIEAFTKAVELNHDNIWAWNNLGYTELQLKKYEDAAEHLAEATSRKGAAGYMFNNLGTALEQLDRLDEARLAFESGGKLGSKEAMSSRKRLEGVESIATITKPATTATTDKPYEVSEPQIDEDQGTVPAPEGVNVDVDSGDATGSDNSTM